MRTSLNNIKLIDDYLLNRMDPGEALVFEAQMLLSAELSNNFCNHKQTLAIVKQYSRGALKAQISAIQTKLSTEPQHHVFMQRIIHLFKK